MNAVDTNILIYVNDPRDPVEQEIAISLVSTLTESILLWQVASEYLAASRKLESYRIQQSPSLSIHLRLSTGLAHCASNIERY